MAKTTIELDPHQAAFISDMIRDGHFANPESAIRAAIDVLQRQMTDFDDLQIAINEGLQAIEQGDHIEIDDADLETAFHALSTVKG